VTTYSYAQLEQLWINAGGPRALAALAAAIAEAESSGNSAAVNATDNGGTQTSWGLWQISNGTHSQPVNNILDPAVNAAQAVAKWKGAGQSFAPWGTYGSGAYRRFMSASTTPDPNVPAGATLTAASSASSGGVGGTTDPTCAFGIHGGLPGLSSLPLIGGAFQIDICFMRKTTIRHMIGGALIGAGALIAIPGVVALVAFSFKASGAQQAAGQVAKFYGPAGRVVSGEAGIARRERRVGRTERVTRLERREKRARQGP
jgi:hypothetical protein